MFEYKQYTNTFQIENTRQLHKHNFEAHLQVWKYLRELGHFSPVVVYSECSLMYMQTDDSSCYCWNYFLAIYVSML